jgi:hypothetical protein
MHTQKSVIGFAAILVAAVLGASATGLEAQAVDGAEQFVGRWTLNVEAPGGVGAGGRGQMGGGGGGRAMAGGGGGGGGRMGAGGPMVLEIRAADGGELTAAITGGMGGGSQQTITDITRSGSDLVLKYTAGAMGRSLPATVRLSPDGETMRVNLEYGEMLALAGTATREE